MWIVVAALTLAALEIAFWIVVAISLSKKRSTIRPAKIEPSAKPVAWKTIVSHCMGVLCVLGWSFGTLMIDFKCARDLYRQFRTRSYLPITGTVLKSQVKVLDRGEDIVHRIDLLYAYVVDNVPYTGSRVSVGIPRTPWEVEKFVAAHPAGSRLTVYHDPAAPQDAVLVRGYSGGPLFLLLFMFPFNVAGLYLWIVLAFALLDRRNGWSLTGIRIVESDDQTRIRTPSPSPLGAALLVSTFASVPLIFVFFCCLGVNPPLVAILTAWFFLLGSVGLIAFVLARKRASGKYDLIIDPQRRTMALPRTFERQEIIELTLGPPLEIRVLEESKKDSDGNFSTEYAILARGRDSSGVANEAKLMELSDRDHAELLAALIRDRAGLPAAAEGRGEPERVHAPIGE